MRVWRENTTSAVEARILREKAVKDRTGLSRTTRWRQEQEGLFPGHVRLGKNSIGWLEHEIEEWIQSRQRVHPPTREK